MGCHRAHLPPLTYVRSCVRARTHACAPYPCPDCLCAVACANVVAHAAAAAQSYDVWNEILHLKKWADRCNLWDNTYRDAFKWINDIDPDAELCINE